VSAEVFFGCAAVLALIWVPRNTNEMRVTFSRLEAAALSALTVVSLVVGYGRGISPFLYFRF